jgi:hypothetical protein
MNSGASSTYPLSMRMFAYATSLIEEVNHNRKPSETLHNQAVNIVKQKENNRNEFQFEVF